MNLELRCIHDYIKEIPSYYFINEYGNIYREVFPNKDGKYNFFYPNGKPNKRYRLKNVESLDFVINYQGKILIPYYPVIDKRDGRPLLRCSKRNKIEGIHRIVGLIYCGIDIYKYDVHHKDKNKLNNHYTNLESRDHIEHLKHHHKDGVEVRKYKSFKYEIEGREFIWDKPLKDFTRKYSLSYKSLHAMLKKYRDRGNEFILYHDIKIYL